MTADHAPHALASADAATPAPADENQLMTERRDKLAAIRLQGVAFPNDFKPAHRAAALVDAYGEQTNEELEALNITVRIGGRMMLKRVMGKASFCTLQDGSLGVTGGRIQLFLNSAGLGEAGYESFKHLDLGDILGAEGVLFKTKTGELSVRVSALRLLTKSLRPLPDKFHGMADQEQKYRQRYVDLITDADARNRFMARSKAVASIRQFMVDHDFMEVETPMLHPIPGGANAKPFTTHHNALDQDMFLRIAPELYLKRLIVGGFERVFEINRSFRNEGISVRHNPEFTMMEFYAAYWNHHDLMDFTEQVLRHAARVATGSATLTYGGKPVDLDAAFTRLTVRDSLVEFTGLSLAEANDVETLRAKLHAHGTAAPAHWPRSHRYLKRAASSCPGSTARRWPTTTWIWSHLRPASRPSSTVVRGATKIGDATTQATEDLNLWREFFEEVFIQRRIMFAHVLTAFCNIKTHEQKFCLWHVRPLKILTIWKQMFKC